MGFDSAERKLLLFEVKEGLRDIVAKLRRQARPAAEAESLESTLEG